MRCNPVLKAFADRLRGRGKRGKPIIVAVMRRLLVLAYGVLKTGQDDSLPCRPFTRDTGIRAGRGAASSDHGTVFKVSTSGAEHVVYSFKGSPGGAIPYARLVSLNGTLYGTTQYGGANGLGTIFKVSASGKEQVLDSFAGPPADGQHPVTGMTLVNGVF